MTAENEEKEAPFDAEWEILKMRGRFTDLLNMIEELKAKDRTLSARISRLRLASIEEEGEEEPEREVRARPEDRLEGLSIEQRALLFAKLMDQQPRG